ncbi:MAG TPA: DUF6644 family protein [Burkholderiales bacterium]|nr:DUF6644 family protein [Burkholderiales bacterium]
MTPIGAIEATPLGQALRDSHLVFGAVATVHLLGVALLFGSIVVLDLRLLGLSRSISVRRLAGHILPWTLISFVLIVPAGLTMFVAHAGKLIASRLFAVKMGLIFAGAVNAAAFHAGVFRSAAAWDTERMPPLAARAAAALSLLIWISVLVCGRMLVAVVS